MEVFKKYQKEIITGLIVGAVIIVFINRAYIQSKLGAQKK